MEPSHLLYRGAQHPDRQAQACRVAPQGYRARLEEEARWLAAPLPRGLSGAAETLPCGLLATAWTPVRRGRGTARTQ